MQLESIAHGKQSVAGPQALLADLLCSLERTVDLKQLQGTLPGTVR